MAVSGSKNFELDVADYVEEAFERCGLEVRTGYDLKTAATLSLPNAVVPTTPVTSTTPAWFQAPEPQLPRPQPATIDTAKLRYAILIIALLASAVGN